MNLKREFKTIAGYFRSLDKKPAIILLSVAVLQTISWYLTSRNFFRENFYDQYFAENKLADFYEYLYWFLSDFVTLLIIPVLIIKLYFKEKISEFGFRAGDYRTGLKISGVLILLILIVLWFVSASPDFADKYPGLFEARTDWNIFFLFEASLLIYMFAWEFIWRGYMLFGLEEKFGFYSVFIQMIPFVILHNGKPAAEAFGAIAGALALGILAFRTRSYFYGVLIHFFTIFTMDIFSVLRYRAGDYGTGFNSLLNIVRNFL